MDKGTIMTLLKLTTIIIILSIYITKSSSINNIYHQTNKLNTNIPKPDLVLRRPTSFQPIPKPSTPLSLHPRLSLRSFVLSVRGGSFSSSSSGGWDNNYDDSNWNPDNRGGAREDYGGGGVYEDERYGERGERERGGGRGGLHPKLGGERRGRKERAEGRWGRVLFLCWKYTLWLVRVWYATLQHGDWMQ